MNHTKPKTPFFHLLRMVPLLGSLLLLAGCDGCARSADVDEDGGESAFVVDDDQLRDELFENAIVNLNRLERFDSGEMPKMIGERKKMAVKLPEDWKGDRLMLTWPEPKMLQQVVSRLSRWVATQRAMPDWNPDPLLKTLPEELAGLPQLQDLGQLKFSAYDGFALREAVWLRDVSTWARGEELDDLERAKKLFDWTVRNIQLDTEFAGRVPLVPWETLFFGHGTPRERAWVFILLARQQGIDAALLAVEKPPKEEAKEEADEEPQLRPWAVGVLARDELYLFEPVLGLPIPAPHGISIGPDGQLEIQPATLRQVAADEQLLRQLDAESGQPYPYPLGSGDLKNVVALVEASPAYLEQRMAMVESHLVGKRKTVLSTSATAQAERFEALAGVSEARLWLWPFQTLAHRGQLDKFAMQRQLNRLLPFYLIPEAPLRKGRMLYLKGQWTGKQGATLYYQRSRPPDQTFDEAAKQDAVFGRLNEEIFRPAKRDASYWLGLLAFERGNYPSAIDYFYKRTLEWWPGGMWTHGAKYNLARAYELTGEQKKAVLTYKFDTNSPAYHGNLLRARWLEERLQ